MTSTWPILDTAYAALTEAVAGVPADAWQAPTPCANWTVAQVAEHAAADQIGLSGIVFGGAKPEFDPFSPPGDHPDHVDLLERALKVSAAAFATVAPGAEDVPIAVPPFTAPAATATSIAALDALVHAWDIAVATGRPSPLTDEDAAAVTGAARFLVTERIRQYGFFGPALDGADGDGPALALLRFLGRDPHWSA